MARFFCCKSGAEKIEGANSRSRVLQGAILSLGCNFLYSVYHGLLGVLHESLWFGVLCAFYGILAAARFCAVVCGSETCAPLFACWQLRISGTLLLLLSVVLAWANATSLSKNLAKSYGTIPMITIATYTFYKVAAVIVRASRQRREKSTQLFVLLNISYAEVAASMVTLQRSMLASFGNMEAEQALRMNALTGGGVCLFILSLGISMIIISGKENTNGKIKIYKSK